MTIGWFFDPFGRSTSHPIRILPFLELALKSHFGVLQEDRIGPVGITWCHIRTDCPIFQQFHHPLISITLLREWHGPRHDFFFRDCCVLLIYINKYYVPYFIMAKLGARLRIWYIRSDSRPRRTGFRAFSMSFLCLTLFLLNRNTYMRSRNDESNALASAYQIQMLLNYHWFLRTNIASHES